MRKDSKKNLMLIGCIESKKSGKGMQVIHLTMGIRTGTNWDGKDLKVKVTKKKKERKIWRVIIANVFKGQRKIDDVQLKRKFECHVSK